ncbi:MAG: AEC family transporter [Stappiaceae bacterium]
MTEALNALVPVLFVMFAGYTIARIGLVEPDQWRGFEKIAYYVLFPSIIMHKLALVEFGKLPVLPMAVTLITTILIMAGIVLALRPVLSKIFGISGPRFTSIFQGITRWNSFVALAIASNLYGEDGLAMMTVAIVAMIPLLNLLNVSVLTKYGDGHTSGLSSVALDLIKNPFIWSTAIGLSLNSFATLSGIAIPSMLMNSLDMMGQAALSAGVLAVGASLDLKMLRRPGPALTTATIGKLVGMPLIAAGIATVVGLQGMAWGIVIIATAVPAASGAYLLARQMGGDAKLMAEILALQAVAAIFTLPLILVLLAL